MAHRRPARIACLLAASLANASLALACSDTPFGPAQPIEQLPRELSAAEVAVISAGNTFAVDLLREVHEAAPDETVFLSPLSASMALGMTMNGTAGATYTQMQGMLGFASLSPSEINESYQTLLELLTELDPVVEVAIANAIFHRSTFPLETPFVQTVRTYFDAHVEGMDFGDPNTVNVINGWVADATNDRITEIVEPPIPSDLVAYLMNAIYFKGDWTKEFDEADTYTGPFHLPDGSTEDVRFMTKKDTLSWRSSDRWSAVEIPYGGGAWVMTVAVPHHDEDLSAVVDDLATLLDPAAVWDERVLDVYLPRFELEWERTLNDQLKALGMVDAFQPALADFSPMSSVPVYVDFVKQKTFLKVDERGTEAAAVTVVGVVLTGAGPVLRADRPFLIAIRERLSGTVLFAGLIVQAPTE